MSSRGTDPADFRRSAIASRLSTWKPMWWMPLQPAPRSTPATASFLKLRIQIDVTVAQVVAPGARAVELRDLLHAEHVDVELRGLVDILGREGDVFDLRHGVSPVAMVRIGRVCLSRQVTPETADWPGQSRPSLRGSQEIRLLEFGEESPDFGERRDVRLARDGYIDEPRRRRALGRHARGAEALDDPDESSGTRIEDASPAHTVVHRRVDHQPAGRGRVVDTVPDHLADHAARQHDVAAERESDDPDRLAENGRPSRSHGGALIDLGPQERQVDGVVAGRHEPRPGPPPRALVASEQRVDLGLARESGDGVPAGQDEAESPCRGLA